MQPSGSLLIADSTTIRCGSKRAHAGKETPVNRKRIKTVLSDVETDLNCDDEEAQWNGFKKLRKLQIDAKSDSWSSTVFDKVIKMLKTRIGDQFEEKHDDEKLQCVLSIIANFCYQNDNAPKLLMDGWRNFAQVLYDILNSEKSGRDLKVTCMRLHANICRVSNGSLLICYHSLLNALISRHLTSQVPEFRMHAFRSVKSMIRFGSYKVMLMADVGIHLGESLLDPTYGSKAVELLQELFNNGPIELDKQLATSTTVIENILKGFFAVDEHQEDDEEEEEEEEDDDDDEDKEMTPIQKFTMRICERGNETRERLETGGMIEKLFEVKNNKVQYLMLTTFSKTAWGRIKLRTTGALDLLVERLEKSTSIKERRTIAASLRYFVHDNAGLSYLAENKSFINTVVMDVQAYVKKYWYCCEPIVEKSQKDDLDCITLEESSSTSTSTTIGPDGSQQQQQQTHIDYYGSWSFDTPPQGRSPQYSPPHSPAFSRSPSYSPPASPTPKPDRRQVWAGNFVYMQVLHKDERSSRDMKRAKEVYTEEKMEHQIVEAGLLLLTSQAQNESSVQHLLREDVVECISSYLLHAPNPDYRCYRILKRLSAVRRWVANLLEMQFHIRVLTDLCATPCRMVKYAKECRRCTRCISIGREILKEFASHVDNPYGHAILLSRMSAEDFATSTAAIIANVTLRRANQSPDPANRNSPKIVEMTKLMLEKFKEMIGNETEFEKKGAMVTYKDGPSLASQVIGAISTLVTPKHIREVTENDQWYKPPTDGFGDCCLIVKESVVNEDPAVEYLTFVTTTDTFLAAVPMTSACTQSSYFEGMFTVNMTEKVTNQRKFTFDPTNEGCTEAEFVQFLHHLAGCTSMCTTVANGEECVYLWQLADRYLCTMVLEKLCAPTGPIRSYLNGNTLPSLMPAALIASAHRGLLDAAMLTLIRYSTHQQVTTTLRELMKLPFIIATFLNKLDAMVDSFIASDVDNRQPS